MLLHLIEAHLQRLAPGGGFLELNSHIAQFDCQGVAAGGGLIALALGVPQAGGGGFALGASLGALGAQVALGLTQSLLLSLRLTVAGLQALGEVINLVGEFNVALVAQVVFAASLTLVFGHALVERGQFGASGLGLGAGPLHGGVALDGCCRSALDLRVKARHRVAQRVEFAQFVLHLFLSLEQSAGAAIGLVEGSAHGLGLGVRLVEGLGGGGGGLLGVLLCLHGPVALAGELVDNLPQGGHFLAQSTVAHAVLQRVAALLEHVALVAQSGELLLESSDARRARVKFFLQLLVGLAGAALRRLHLFDEGHQLVERRLHMGRSGGGGGAGFRLRLRRRLRL